MEEGGNEGGRRWRGEGMEEGEGGGVCHLHEDILCRLLSYLFSVLSNPAASGGVLISLLHRNCCVSL